MLKNFSSSTIDKSIRQGNDNFPEVMAITSGKGGVGKSSLSVNLAIILRQTKKKVLLIDADIHLGNIDLILGIRTKYSISDIVKGNISVGDAIISGPGEIDILPASSAVSELLELEDVALKNLSEAFAEYEHNYDLVLLDTGAGITQNVTSFLLGSDKILLIVTPDPASIADAYAIIKVVKKIRTEIPIILIVNMASSHEEGETLFKKMSLMVQKFLANNIEYGGSVLMDEMIRKSIKKQRPFILDYPNSSCSKNLHLLKRKILSISSLEASRRKNLFTNFRLNRKVSLELDV